MGKTALPPLRTFTDRPLKHVTTALLIAAIAAWSVVPHFTHAPTLLGAQHGHIDHAADHGHSHDFLADLLWALHGHAHDVADHDHSPVVLLRPPSAQTALFKMSDVQLGAMRLAAIDLLPFERPPRG